jgi:hypothetical protein
MSGSSFLIGYIGLEDIIREAVLRSAPTAVLDVDASGQLMPAAKESLVQAIREAVAKAPVQIHLVNNEFQVAGQVVIPVEMSRLPLHEERNHLVTTSYGEDKVEPHLICLSVEDILMRATRELSAGTTAFFADIGRLRALVESDHKPIVLEWVTKAISNLVREAPKFFSTAWHVDQSETDDAVGKALKFAAPSTTIEHARGLLVLRSIVNAAPIAHIAGLNKLSAWEEKKHERSAFYVRGMRVGDRLIPVVTVFYRKHDRDVQWSVTRRNAVSGSDIIASGSVRFRPAEDELETVLGRAKVEADEAAYHGGWIIPKDDVTAAS